MDPVAAYHDFTDLVREATGLPNSVLHIHAGMAIYLVSQFMLGTRRGSVTALLIVIEVELFNEVMNRFYWGSWRWSDTLQDIALTLFWPAMCVAVGKFRRWRWARKQLRRDRIQAMIAGMPSPSPEASASTVNARRM